MAGERRTPEQAREHAAEFYGRLSDAMMAHEVPPLTAAEIMQRADPEDGRNFFAVLPWPAEDRADGGEICAGDLLALKLIPGQPPEYLHVLVAAPVSAKVVGVALLARTTTPDGRPPDVELVHVTDQEG